MINYGQFIRSARRSDDLHLLDDCFADSYSGLVYLDRFAIGFHELSGDWWTLFGNEDFSSTELRVVEEWLYNVLRESGELDSYEEDTHE